MCPELKDHGELSEELHPGRVREVLRDTNQLRDSVPPSASDPEPADVGRAHGLAGFAANKLDPDKPAQMPDVLPADTELDTPAVANRPS